MARVAAFVAVFLSLFFLFTSSHARDIHDPSSKPESEPATTLSEPKPQQHDTVSLTLDSVDPVPLNLLSFSPINRHAVLRRPLPLSLRLGHRRCRHGPRREIPYGNDAIFRSDVADGDHSGGVRQIPTRWVEVRHAMPRITEMMAHEHHHHRDHHHHGEHREKKHGKGWFMKRIGSFLNLF